MLFCTWPYFVFLALLLLALRVSERTPRLQKLLLLGASNFFYGYWDWRFLGLLWLTTVVDFNVARWIERERRPGPRRAIFLVSIVLNLSLLGFFKYFDFFQDSARRLLDGFGIPYDPWLLGVALPVGISFYVFQSMSYVIDVWRGRMEASRRPIDFALFVMYFPQLVAGPIERAPHLLPQLAGVRRVRLQGVLSGALLILWGTFKKALVADTAGLYLVQPAYDGPQGGLELVLATVAFGFQIYGDFSGYCDIARGTSRCMGVELVENFEAPYFAANITDFWRRWHVSLSSWFRDYLYIPLGGNRRGTLRTVTNLCITMLLCGLWHGAKLTFVAWGAWHGLLLLLHRLLAGQRRHQTPRFGAAGSKVAHVLRCLATFGLVTYGWMLFKIGADTQIVPYTVLFFDWTSGFEDPAYAARLADMARSLLVLALPIFCAHVLQDRADRLGEQIEDLPLAPAAIGALGGILAVLLLTLGTLGERLPFIYFQF